MAVYKNKESLLKEALGNYHGLGFRLQEPDDHITELYHPDHCIARFNQNRITIVVLQQTCQNYLDNVITKVGNN